MFIAIPEKEKGDFSIWKGGGGGAGFLTYIDICQLVSPFLFLSYVLLFFLVSLLLFSVPLVPYTRTGSRYNFEL